MQLLAHPDTRPGPVHDISVRAERRGAGRLHFSWRLTGDLAQLRLPEEGSAPVRADGLWRHTCFEVFVSPAVDGGYVELNFSPAQAWSVYSFTDYRAGMASRDIATPPAARWSRSATRLALDVDVAIDDLLPGQSAGALRVGLAAVVEDASGTIGYWALHHPAGKPDFHHPDAFALELADAPAHIGHHS